MEASIARGSLLLNEDFSTLMHNAQRDVMPIVYVYSFI